ncbi:MAG: hypothetical protein ABIO36_01995 [Pyrinomonadaceae bacterium]
MRSNFDRFVQFNIRFYFAAIFVVVVAVMAPLTARGQFLHPKIVGKQTTIRSVVILPAKVDIVRNGMKGPEGIAAESEELSSRIEKGVAEVLANQKKIKTLSGPAVSSDGSNAQTKYTVADIQTKFDDLLTKVMKKRSDVKKGRFSMGDEVLNLNLDKSADAIVFIRGGGQKLTSGKTAFKLLVGGTSAYLALQIGIIDARSGEVLLYTDPYFLGDPTTAVDRLRNAIEKGFKKIPVPQTTPATTEE